MTNVPEKSNYTFYNLNNWKLNFDSKDLLIIQRLSKFQYNTCKYGSCDFHCFENICIQCWKILNSDAGLTNIVPLSFD